MLYSVWYRKGIIQIDEHSKVVNNSIISVLKCKRFSWKRFSFRCYTNSHLKNHDQDGCHWINIDRFFRNVFWNVYWTERVYPVYGVRITSEAVVGEAGGLTGSIGFAMGIHITLVLICWCLHDIIFM